MDTPRILTNSERSDRLLTTKLLILQKTLRVRGVEVQILKSSNLVFDKVHGFNTIELASGDRSDEVTITTCRLVLNLNNLEHVGEKGAGSQTVYHTVNIADEGDVVVYRSRMYEYAFKVDRKQVYGEKDFLYEYELNHFRTIKIPNDTLVSTARVVNKVFLNEDGTVTTESVTKTDCNSIDQLFTNQDSDYPKTGVGDPNNDWRNTIDNLDKI